VSLVFGIVSLWIGCALVWVATHATGATTPWGVYQRILSGVGGPATGGAESSGTPGQLGAEAAA
jgi:hypothetical protein